jgi:hypothetical protein
LPRCMLLDAGGQRTLIVKEKAEGSDTQLYLSDPSVSICNCMNRDL